MKSVGDQVAGVVKQLGRRPQKPGGCAEGTKLSPIALVGRRIRVWWLGDGCWYKGTVVEYLEGEDQHIIEYDDGDREGIKTKEEIWRLLHDDSDRPRALRSTGVKRPLDSGASDAGVVDQQAVGSGGGNTPSTKAEPKEERGTGSKANGPGGVAKAEGGTENEKEEAEAEARAEAVVGMSKKKSKLEWGWWNKKEFKDKKLRDAIRNKLGSSSIAHPGIIKVKQPIRTVTVPGGSRETASGGPSTRNRQEGVPATRQMTITTGRGRGRGRGRGGRIAGRVGARGSGGRGVSGRGVAGRGVSGRGAGGIGGRWGGGRGGGRGGRTARGGRGGRWGGRGRGRASAAAAAAAAARASSEDTDEDTEEEESQGKKEAEEGKKQKQQQQEKQQQKQPAREAAATQPPRELHATDLAAAKHAPPAAFAPPYDISKEKRVVVMRGAGFEVHRVDSPPCFELFCQLPGRSLDDVRVQAGDSCVVLFYREQGDCADGDAPVVRHCKMVIHLPGSIDAIGRCIFTPEGRLYLQVTVPPTAIP